MRSPHLLFLKPIPSIRSPSFPRGLALGLTQQLPIDDRYTHSKKYLEAQLSVLLAGRVAEILFLEKTTTGAASDFERATDIARKMVCQYGMSALGPLTFGERDDLVFLGKDLAMHKNFSEKTAEHIDEEVKNIIGRNYNRAEEILKNNKTKLIKIAEALLEREILDSREIKTLIEGKKLPKNSAAAQKRKEPQKKTRKTSKGEKRTAKPASAKA